MSELKEMSRLQSYFKNLKSELLYSDANRITNLLFAKEKTQKALLNGLEVQVSKDVTLSNHVIQNGDRQGKENATFNLDIFRT